MNYLAVSSDLFYAEIKPYGEENSMKKFLKSIALCLLFSMLAGCISKPVDTPAPTEAPVPTGPEATAPTKTPAPTATEVPKQVSTRLSYPTMHADIPDLDIIRVGETYYMVSTTMNMCPGAPIMKSTDLGHWEIVNYVYETFADDDVTNLENGRDMYAHGSWAAS